MTVVDMDGEAGTGSATAVVWAKWREGAGAPYPLVAHLLDTAAFARVLCEGWLPLRVLRRLAKMLDVSDGGAVRTVVSAAALHDVGKANPVFATQRLSPARRRFAEHAGVLTRAGLTSDPPALPRRPTADELPWLRRHEVCSAVLLSGGFDDRVARGLPAVVGGHHGRWRIPDWDAPDSAHDFYGWLLSDAGWSGYHDHLLRTLSSAADVDPDAPVPDAAAVPLLTGLVCLADWLASDLADREQAPEVGTDWHAHYRRRCEIAPDRINELLGVPYRPTAPFSEVFSFGTTRPVQEHLTADGVAGLRVVMAPTGDGKTEAALGHWLNNADERQGLIFALPTMATADAMLPRIRSMFDSADTATFGVLRHGRSMLNEFYDLPVDDLRGEFHDDHDHDGGPRDDADRLVPGEWFQGRHRALLAPVAVTTADQILLGVLRHRYNFMRLVGTTTKTVVFDEVHSYDPYMARLLEQFLRWAAALHVDVVLLSATLPAVQLDSYVSAYTGGTPPDGEPAYPAVVTATPGSPPYTQPLDASARSRTLALAYERAPEPATGTAEVVRRLRDAHPHAKIGVIVNTVGRCQQIGRALAADGLEPDVMHSRFPASLRAQHIGGATDDYGKTSKSGPALLVATQVVEQSVDLDFDVLVTDLCPAPSLLQRAGRLHRHDHHPARRTRPDGLHVPTVHVVVPDPVPQDQLRAFLPYPAAPVITTWERSLESGGRTTVRVPDDVQAFVEDAHVTLEQMDAHHERAADAYLLDRVVQAEHARRVTIPSPQDIRDNSARALTEFCAGELDEGHFQTRWSDLERADVLLVGQSPHTWHGRLPAHPDRDTVRELLGCVVSLSGPVAGRVTPSCKTPSEMPEGWDEGLLRTVAALDLDATDRWDLDPLVGLVERRT